MSIYADDKEITAFIADVKNRATKFRHIIKKFLMNQDPLKDNIYFIIGAQKKYIPDYESWKKSHILLNMKKPSAAKKTKIYISCGDSDEYGFFIGSQKLAEHARSLHYQVKWKLLSGGHNVMDKEEIADFFMSN